MSEHITRLAERLQQQVGESHNKPTGKQFEEMLTDALDAEHLTIEPATDEPETETEDDVPEGFERTVKGVFGLSPIEEFNMDSADRYAEYKSLGSRPQIFGACHDARRRKGAVRHRGRFAAHGVRRVGGVEDRA